MKENMTSNKCLVSCFTIFTLFIFASLLLFYSGKTIDYRSKFLLFSSPPTNHTPCTTQSPPLNVYMYDLGTKYNVGMLNGSGLNGPPVTRETLPEYPNYVGLRRQHTVEYWMLASLLLYNGTTYGEAVRVMNPDLGDVFFVPFFSSLSYDTYNHHGNYSESKVDDQLQAEIVDFLQKSKYWKRSAGRDHVIPMQHPNAFKRYREKVNAAIFVVADFGRPSPAVSNLRKDVVVPYGHVVGTFEADDLSDPYDSRTTLLFFRGRTDRKAEGKDRKRLEKILSGQKDVVFEVKEYSEEGVNASTKGMRSSKFCLDPAGDTPSSCRLFDAIVSHCVPVIVSDKIELPYEDEIDYKKFSIFFSREEAKKEGYILDQLRSISKPKWVEMWRYLKNITHHFEYQYPPKNGDAVNMIWRQVKHKLPAVKLAVHRNRRLKVPDWWR
ncbi:probable arabinosyltransferase ARAD1 isoform X1 [Lycium ferocissimum]|uniref:probable arabinosyltransferase ARAD1 isoform X1 n=1 Tax=Lycium ferocissimum TaxID=112874 RepID=UPI002815C607|nr:probable arabinosyltransferase ARAD1 isoform X1 [Lycium ferocissimum]